MKPLGSHKHVCFGTISVYISVYEQNNKLSLFLRYSNTERVISKYRYNGVAHTPSYLDTAIASMVAGGISVIVGAPVDLVKIRLQAQTGTRTLNEIPGPISKNKSINPGKHLCDI